MDIVRTTRMLTARKKKMRLPICMSLLYQIRNALVIFDKLIRVRVLLFGGSFDPPHRGHAALLRSALKTLRPDKTYVLPAYRSPLKSPPRTSPEDRLAMTR